MYLCVYLLKKDSLREEVGENIKKELEIRYILKAFIQKKRSAKVMRISQKTADSQKNKLIGGFC